jgi:hypothetical protein
MKEGVITSLNSSVGDLIYFEGRRYLLLAVTLDFKQIG